MVCLTDLRNGNTIIGEKLVPFDAANNIYSVKRVGSNETLSILPNGSFEWKMKEVPQGYEKFKVVNSLAIVKPTDVAYSYGFMDITGLD